MHYVVLSGVDTIYTTHYAEFPGGEYYLTHYTVFSGVNTLYTIHYTIFSGWILFILCTT